MYILHFFRLFFGRLTKNVLRRYLTLIHFIRTLGIGAVLEVAWYCVIIYIFKNNLKNPDPNFSHSG